MKIDIQKLDERIKKLQEVRKIAADQELVNTLLEFVSDEAVAVAPPHIPKVESHPRPDSTHELVKEIVNGAPAETRDGLWSKRR